MSTLQTLDRGIRALEVVAASDGLSIPELSARLGVARAIGHRLATTLETHGLVVRDAAGRLHLGAGLAVLAGRWWPSVLTRAPAVLQDLAERTAATGFLAVAEGEEAVVVLACDPGTSVLRVGYRVGSRHPLSRGASGLALRAARPELPGDPEAVREARRRGWAATRGQLQDGAVGVAAALPRSGSAWSPEACVGVVSLGDFDVDAAAPQVLTAAASLTGADGEPPAAPAP
ncbi:IclR family transcriptional regulator [Auraticoccus monumenti]|uniref:DNA-binding transcriptional regulator, IclR family n=1 Tax=Auraticoccus monumenti TaxID=675864 RepID=A0A1G6SU90_9ACTN|nr:helix-turn-helix domain-containing protein [Auraticoccus monumenti]SDD20194.1 DNA-binding transcriptional regulator, IclR family [Auraticoccus monumenti]